MQVNESNREAAQTLLESVSSLGLSPDQASQWVGRDVPLAPDRRWFLLRGVVINPGTARVMVEEGPEGVIVSYNAVGWGRTLVRWPVVAALRDEPTEVFTDASTAR